MSDIQERLKKLIEKLDLNPNSFSERVNVSSSVIYHIIGGRKNAPSADLLGKISMAFASINIGWLLTGKGDMLKPADAQGNNHDGRSGYIPSVVTVNTSGKDNVVMVPIKAQAGYLRGLKDTHYFEKLPAFYLPRYTNGIYRAFEVDGYSMLTEQGIGLHPTDIVVCKYVEKLEDVRDNKVYVIVNNAPNFDDILIKRCFNTVASYNWLLCKSDNKSGEYPDIHLDPKNIKELWEWKGMLSAYYPNVADVYQQLNQITVELSYLRQQISKPELP